MKKLGLVVSSIIVVVIVAGVWSWFHQNKAVKTSTKAILIKVEKVANYNVPLRVKAVGEVIAPQTIMLSAKQSGSITAVDFKPGQQVKQGQLLLQIDDAVENANFAQQLANYNNLKTQYGRYKSLQRSDGQSVAADVVSQKQGAMEVALAQLQAAKKQLADTKIEAPFAGIIGIPQPVSTLISLGNQQLHEAMQLSVGSYIKTGTPIAVLTNPESIVVQYQVPQEYSEHLQLDQPVLFTSSAYPGKPFTGKVIYISPTVIASSQAYNVRAIINNTHLELKSGMNGLVSQTLEQQRSVLAIPGISLVPSLTGYDVYMIEKGKVKAVPVSIGERYKTLVAITSGIKAGDEIIVSGIEKVHPGMKVKIKQS